MKQTKCFQTKMGRRNEREKKKKNEGEKRNRITLGSSEKLMGKIILSSSHRERERERVN